MNVRSGPASSGLVGRGGTRLGEVSSGTAGNGSASHGEAGHGGVRSGKAGRGNWVDGLRRGSTPRHPRAVAAWFGRQRQGRAWLAKVRFGLARLGSGGRQPSRFEAATPTVVGLGRAGRAEACRGGGWVWRGMAHQPEGEQRNDDQ